MTRILHLILLLGGLLTLPSAHQPDGSEWAIIPEPKEFRQTGSKTFKLKKVITDTTVRFSNPDEYQLIIRRGEATITGNCHWAKSTLAQITDRKGKVPDVTIHDWSAYPFRGFMHDTGRNFQTVSMLKETLDLMSFYKLNCFHWHLTDNPAWRIECKVFPQLNDPRYQVKGRDEGKFYSYDEIREIIAYARARGITIVPEIDMPGHSAYFKNTFGFTMDSEQGRAVLEKCLDEFFTEIPKSDCPYFHIGSDEVRIQDPEGFMAWLEKITERYDRQPIAWDPGLPTSGKTIRQVWINRSAPNDKPGKYLDSFTGYLNHYDPMLFTSRLFLHTAAAQTTPDTSEAMGGTLCLWNDIRVDRKENISLHNGMINGMMAFSERFWNGGNAGPVENALLPPDPQTETGARLADFEKKIRLHRDRFHRGKMRWVANSQLKWMVQVNDSEPFPAYGGAVNLDAFCQTHSIQTADSAFAIARTTIFAQKEMDAEVWLGFDTPARSNRNGYGIGKQGRWEGEGQCFVNGTEILPPKAWEEPGKYNYHFNTWGKPAQEEPYTDEQFYWMREPARIHLKKGQNQVEIRIPKTYKGFRWSFAFIPVRTQKDGRVTEAEGLRYL